MAETTKPPCESGRTMRIMLSEPMRKILREKPRSVIVDRVPWELFETQHSRAQCESNHGQTIEQISSRGGFDAGEAVGVLSGLDYGELRFLREDQAHRILYQMVHLFRRGVLTGRRSMQEVSNG
ncbi:hypothetical protein [Methylobacterium radiotolerans]|uniref:hypothetical protein n=1 Tax=Methylobacterium radiotolerans TaxID=31998 RepID=UPI000D5EBB28|nr:MULTISPECIES: hypothetical protein [Methylobacterium]MDE3749449.1 hypothetical protein [Methylobacterium radiotolerans]PVY97878.1 hypothetical protein C7388_112131 [Methylobacterium organophilum]